MIVAKQEGSPNKVLLTSPDSSGVNQLLFTSPELAGQQIQVLPEDINDLFSTSFDKQVAERSCDWNMDMN